MVELNWNFPGVVHVFHNLLTGLDVLTQHAK